MTNPQDDKDRMTAEEYARGTFLREPECNYAEEGFLAGVAFGRQSARKEAEGLIGDLEHVLENAASLDGEMSIGHEGAMCLKVALQAYRAKETKL